MKSFFTIFFVVLGVIFLLLIIAVTIFLIIDPFGLRQAFVSQSGAGGYETSTLSGGDVAEDRNPALSPAQEQALKSFGIDPAQIPSEITPEQEACFVARLGAARVEEIKAGAMPTAAEFFKARDCIE
jgi:hypothetical protein